MHAVADDPPLLQRTTGCYLGGQSWLGQQVMHLIA